ncbi:hypothetical protein KEM54_001158 [Ascosphaera aggregata]|nr:hypothetical protein KEM54_001158 [Ascosphaera aggregata]
MVDLKKRRQRESTVAHPLHRLATSSRKEWELVPRTRNADEDPIKPDFSRTQLDKQAIRCRQGNGSTIAHRETDFSNLRSITIRA